MGRARRRPGLLAVTTVAISLAAAPASAYRAHPMLDVDEQVSRDVFKRDRNNDGIDDFFRAGADRGVDCPTDCRFALRNGHQKIVVKDVWGNVGDVGVRRLYSARPRQVYRAAMWVKVNGSDDDFRARLTIAAYEEGGRRPLRFECDESTADTNGEFVKLAIGSDSTAGGSSDCVLPRRTRTVWFKFRAIAGTESSWGSVTIDRVWFTRCPNESDGGCDASNDSPD